MALILVVDGDERFRTSCAQGLAREGHDVLTATEGFEALRLVDDRVPDVVITEVRLPGMDGLDLMSRLLADHRRVVVVLVSGSSYYKHDFQSWVADACLTKPIDVPGLQGVVRELLERRPTAAELTHVA
jgi:DNA-binding response OmpR family regulator